MFELQLRHSWHLNQSKHSYRLGMFELQRNARMDFNAVHVSYRLGMFELQPDTDLELTEEKDMLSLGHV